MKRSVVLGCGSYLPSRVLTNAELAQTVDTSDEWIVQRTATGELTSDLALHAARAALAHAKVDAQSIDLIVLATSTPDHTFPASAVSVQAGLGITQGAAFDLQAVCSGFVYALATVDGLLRTGAFQRALVVGSMRRNSQARARIAGFSPRICAPTAATKTNFMWTAAHRARRRWAICAWRAAMCSAMRLAPLPM